MRIKYDETLAREVIDIPGMGTITLLFGHKESYKLLNGKRSECTTQVSYKHQTP